MDRGTAEPRVESFPGENARKWVDFHREYAAPSEHSHDFVWQVTDEATGPFVTDVDGNVLLDFTCHIGAAPLGYNNPYVLDRLREFDLVDPLKIAGQDLYFAGGETPAESSFPGSSHLMERLVEITDQYDMDTVFLSNSGAEAVENALKAAYDDAAAPKHVVTFEGAFHGRTFGTLSLTRGNHVYSRKYPEIAGVRTLPFCSTGTCDEGECTCGFFRGGTSRLAELVHPESGELHPREVAAVVLEPVQGVGGYRFPTERFLREVQRVCADRGVRIVVDEIQSGLGRTGEWWASDHYALEPDLIASGKALRVGATVGSADVFPDEANRLGSTWGGGDVVASMQGAFTVDAIRENDLMANARERGRQFRERLADAALPAVTDVRGAGLMLAVEFDAGERRDDAVEAALRRGLLTLGCGEKTLRVLPPLDVTEREIDMGASILVEAVRDATPSAPRADD